MKKYHYLTSCVDLHMDDVDALNSMIETSESSNYQKMLRHCEGLLDWAINHGYSLRKGHGLTLKDDWAVGFHRSQFKGVPCLYMVWSAIEFIWVRSG